MKLFVYGTLKPRHSSLFQSRSLGRARLPGRFYDLGACPGAILAPDAPGFVYGEVVEGGDDAALLAALDAYEGPEFHRERVAVRTEDGAQHACWIYVLAHEPANAPRIESGSWDPAGD